MKKIIELRDLDSQLKKIADKKKVLAGGCFDLFHYGHLTFLKNAKKQGDYLIIFLESDEFIKVHKQREPIHTQFQRAEILAALDCVDLIVRLPFLKTDQEYEKLVRKTKPEIIAVSKGDKNLSKKNNQAKLIGARMVEVTDLLESFSSNNIRKILHFDL